MKRPPDVGLLVETSNGYARALRHGICGYMRKFGPWSVHFAEQSRGADPLRWPSLPPCAKLYAAGSRRRVADYLR